MSADVNIDLTDLQEIMNELPDPPYGSEHRRHALTKNDIVIIARIVAAVGHQSCAAGFTTDEISVIKKLVGGLNKGILVVGYSVLAAIGAGIVSGTCWAVKHGIIDLAKGK